MLRVSKNITKKELRRIAKTIQWHYKSNFAKTYHKAFSYITEITRYNEDKKLKLRLAIENSIMPSRKMQDPSEVQSILRQLGYHRDHRQYRYIEYMAKFRIQPIDMIVSELIALMENFNGINFSNDTLTVEMGPFIIKDVNFGNFQVKLHVTECYRISYNICAHAYAVTPNYSPGDSECTHPHVRNGDVCIGNGATPLNNAATEGRLQDYFEIVRSVLSTYNDADPYMKIIAWTGKRCRSCNRHYEPEDRNNLKCTICKIQYCSYCTRQCCSASELTCFSCVPNNFKCKYCGASLCAECLKICERCNKRLCNSHLDYYHHRCN
jgi:hypothetical protein